MDWRLELNELSVFGLAIQILCVSVLIASILLVEKSESSNIDFSVFLCLQRRFARFMFHYRMFHLFLPICASSISAFMLIQRAFSAAPFDFPNVQTLCHKLATCVADALSVLLLSDAMTDKADAKSKRTKVSYVHPSRRPVARAPASISSSAPTGAALLCVDFASNISCLQAMTAA